MRWRKFYLYFGIILFSLLILILCTPKEKEKKVAKKFIPKEGLQCVDKAIYKTKEINGEKRTVLTLDFSKIERPKSPEEFTQYFHFPPISQGKTGTCWCFSTTSFLESELKRLGKGEIKLSEMYTVYWEYVEKARRFIREKGNSFFGQGSEHNAVIERIKKYGIVRASDYTGLLSGKKTHDHTELFKELKAYLNFLKENNYWDEETAIEYVKAILNKHLGKPPEKIIVDGKEMTPKEYLDNVLQLPLDDYVAIISFKYLPFYTKGEYKVPDNWWHSKDYYNVPLDEFYKAIVNAIKNGFTVAIGGDISEPGKSGEEDIAIIPSFDIPFSCINQDSREFRFYNKTSTDDHAVHLVGYKRIGNHDWFLIKDSGRSAFVGKFKGYYFYRDDYIKLKMLNILVHKDAVKDLLSKFKE
ncbi:C1 family peptidase [Candidatus Aminicenantes bacterium AC-335-K20]|nr:C1 family peptidase [SCandidatus Aminicenantes bacterium Aminicenantia_JdfR_composite]MCP2596400.1 C1 family peptidase [Candidatus Aminicenantes bacterium AC-335-G13]MCP2606205.1 C1 family peptidase [Candidatus Aminicenantes bacterium AC-708-I09]MCP2618222.1 C1 family peptidase [Candidatus Aminicenantes bacterium AC-335-A11]MCP2619482.1 C1 family peptidase [Candidatus Aminicenantes bacterium AC-335-K20]